VRDALRTDLLDAYRRDRVQGINQLALDLYTARLREMRTRWPTLDQQLDNEDFGKALLAALWHTSGSTTRPAWTCSSRCCLS
jgi:hypothetical protein